VQDDLARAVVDAVGSELGVTPAGTALAEAPPVAAPVTPPTRVGDVNPVAYDHYLRGRALFQRRDARSLTAALREYALAVKADPTFARAYAGIATVQAQLPKYTDADPRTTNAAGLVAANKALALDPTLAEAIRGGGARSRQGHRARSQRSARSAMVRRAEVAAR
jgi:hypothetical protein